MKILSCGSNAQLGTECILTRKSANEGSYGNTKDNGVRSGKLCHIGKYGYWQTHSECTVDEYVAHTECLIWDLSIEIKGRLSPIRMPGYSRH